VIDWPLVRLAEFLRPVSHPQKVLPDVSYPTCGVYGFGRGIIMRAPVIGRDMSAATLFRLSAGLFLYSRLKAFEGAFCIVPPPADGRFVSNEFPTLAVDLERADPDFIEWSFRRPALWHELRQQSSGTIKRRERLHVEDLLEFRLPLPPLRDQRRIVDLLNRAAGIRRLREAALAKARETIRALFLSMFGDPATNPMGWPVRRLGDLLSEPPRNGVSPATGGTYPGRVMTLSAITGAHFDGSEVKDAAFARPLSGRDRVRADDMLLCRGNGNPNLVGRGFFPTSDMPDVAFPDTMIAIHPDRQVIAPLFLETAWGTNALREQILALARTTNGTFKINQGMVTQMALPVPPIAHQAAFSERLSDLRSIITHQERALAIARDTERALMAQLLG
jgi:type I restriction enzyme S subunit